MVITVGAEFSCHHRDRPGSVALREELPEEHWSYLDLYQAQMITRGSTLAGDICGLPDPAAARAPPSTNRATRPACNGRCGSGAATCWAHHAGFPGQRGRRQPGSGTRPGHGQPADLAVPPGRDEPIAYGPLLSGGGAAGLGTAVMLRASDPDKARAILTPGGHASIEVHCWQFGGRGHDRRTSAFRNPAAEDGQ
jgi:hypothetical protein